MNGTCTSLSEFLFSYRFWGEWSISYYDRTHLRAGAKVRVADFMVPYDENAANGSLYLPYILHPNSESEIRSALESAGIVSTDPTEVGLPSARLILDLLAESAARSGALQYELELLGSRNLSDALPKLFKLPYVILVTDTGAVRLGISSFITQSLPQKTVWTIVPVFVMIEVQERADNLKSISSENAPNSKNIKILRQRPQVTCVAREIQSIKLNRPIEFIQAPPELISRVKGFEPEKLRAGKDTLRDSLNDRLIIEATKKLRQERSLGKELFLATSDKNTASLAQLENLDAIYIKKPQMTEDLISLRYNPYASDHHFIVSPVHSLIWDLAHVMSSIHLESNKQGKHYELRYYSDYRLDLTHDVLEIVQH